MYAMSATQKQHIGTIDQLPDISYYVTTQTYRPGMQGGADGLRWAMQLAGYPRQVLGSGVSLLDAFYQLKGR